MPSSNVFEKQPLIFNNNQFLGQEQSSSSVANTPHLDAATSSTVANGPAHVIIELGDHDHQIESARSITNVPTNSEHDDAAGESVLEQLRRHASNVAVSASRNVASVGVPTFLREMVRRTLLQQMVQGSTAAGVVGAVGAGAVLPIGLQAYGLWRDNENRTQTRISIASRVAQIVVTGSTLAALAATGGAAALAAAAPALMASNLVYTPLRDAVQYNLRLRNNANSTNERPMSILATGISAAAYAVNQTAVSYGMDHLSPVLTPNTRPESLQVTSQQPSTGSTLTSEDLPTPSSLITTETWNDSIANAFGHAAGRTPINIVGEIGDDMVSGYSQALLNGTKDGKPLAYSLDIRPADARSWEKVADQVTDAHASRSNLFASALNAAYLTSAITNDNPHATNVVVGGILGLLYTTFVGSGSRPPSADEVLQIEEGRGIAAGSTFPTSMVEVNETNNSVSQFARGNEAIEMTHINRAPGSRTNSTSSVALFETAASSPKEQS